MSEDEKRMSRSPGRRSSDAFNAELIGVVIKPILDKLESHKQDRLRERAEDHQNIKEQFQAIHELIKTHGDMDNSNSMHSKMHARIKRLEKIVLVASTAIGTVAALFSDASRKGWSAFIKFMGGDQ